MKYKVHCYAVVRVPIDIEAESQQEAMEKAADTDFAAIIDNDSDDYEYAEEIVGYLVDEEGDTEYTNTRAYDADMNVTGGSN